MQICWSCQLRACDAKSLRILLSLREEVILDLQRSRLRPNSKSAVCCPIIFGLRNCPFQSLYSSILELLLRRNFRAVCISLPIWHPLDSDLLRPPWLSSFWGLSLYHSLLSDLTTKFQLQDHNIFSIGRSVYIWILIETAYAFRFPLIAYWTLWIALY